MEEIGQQKKERISEVGCELKKALEAWEDLNKQVPRLSADEQMLQDMQSLLKKLQNQMEEFR